MAIADNIRGNVSRWCSVNKRKREFVADSIGMDRRSFYSRLSGSVDWRLTEFVRLSKLLDEPMDELVS